MKHTFISLAAAFGLLFTTLVQAQNVGIGTATPTQKLDVNGSLRVRGLTGVESRLVQVQPDGTLGTGATLPPVTILTSPPNLGSVSIASPRGAAVQGDYLYVTQYIGPNNSKLQVYDISNPTSPQAVGTPVTGGNRLDLLTVNGNYIYVCDLSANTIRVYTTTGTGTPTNPKFLTTVAAGNGPNGAAVVGTNLYVANYNGSNITRFDISNPAAPSSQATIAAGTNVAGLTALNGYLYAANYGANQLQTYAVDAAGTLTSQSVVNVGTQPNAVATANNLLYLTNAGAASLQTFSLSNPAQPTALNTLPTGVQPYSFAVKGNYAYIANTGSNTVEVRQLSLSNALGFDNNGVLASLPSTAFGDNLGNHTATTSLNLNGNLLVGGTLNTPGTKGLFVDADGLVGVGTQTPTTSLEVNGTVKLGTAGTTLNSIIRATVNINPGNIAVNSAVTATFNMPNLTSTATVFLSPANDLETGVNISYARVSTAGANGVVTVKFSNSTNATINPAAQNYYVTVVQ